MRNVLIVDGEVITLPSRADLARQHYLDAGLDPEEFIVEPIARRPYLHARLTPNGLRQLNTRLQRSE